MPRQRRRAASPDPVSLVMRFLEAVAACDEQQMARATANLEGMKTRILVDALGNVGGLIAPKIKPEQLDVIREELAAAPGPPEIQTAIRDVGTLLVVTPNAQQAYEAIIRHGAEVRHLGEGIWPAILMLILTAVGRAFGRLNITMTWG
jgi:hypothetical protein